MVHVINSDLPRRSPRLPGQTHMPATGRPPRPGDIPSYRGGHTRVNHRGYVFEHAPDHPGCNKDGMVLQHRLVLEDKLGRYLSGTEVGYHIDGNLLNNDPRNLDVHDRRNHMVLDAADDGRDKKLSAEKVREALQGRSTAAAAVLLGVHHQTLRNRFPHLLNKRRTPNSRKNEKTIEMVRNAASDPAIGYRELARSTGISSTLAKRICDEQGFQWQTRQVKHPVPPQMTPIPSRSAGDDRPGGPFHQPVPASAHTTANETARDAAVA